MRAYDIPTEVEHSDTRYQVQERIAGKTTWKLSYVTARKASADFSTIEKAQQYVKTEPARRTRAGLATPEFRVVAYRTSYTVVA